jgi:oligoendopeptidase F
LIAADPSVAEAPSLRRWRSELLQWARFVPFLVDDATEAQLSTSGRAAISGALTELAALDSAAETSIEAAECGVHLLDSLDRNVRSTADARISEVTSRRAPTMCDILQRLTASHAADDQARGIDSWRVRFALSQQTSTATLDHLLAAVNERADLARSWYSHRAVRLGARYADRRIGPPVPPMSLADDAVLVAAALGSVVPELGSDAERAAARIRPGATNEVVFEADGRLSATVDHRPTARGRLMVAHELGHTVHALRASSDGAPGALVGETMACLAAIIAGLRLADDPTVDHAAATLAVGDMMVEELFVSALVCQFEDEAQRAVRGGGKLTVAFLDGTWLRLHRQLFGEVIEVPAIIGSQWARLSSLAMQPGHAVSYVWATVLALAVQSRLLDGESAEGRRLVAAIERGAMPADELPVMLGFANDSWVDVGLDALDGVLAKLCAADTMK